MLPKKYCRGVIFDLVSLKMCERNLNISMSTAGFLQLIFLLPGALRGANCMEKH